MNPFFSATGAVVSAAAAAGDAQAIAEVARRAAKPAKTVAALKSRGLVVEAQARIDAAKAKATQPKPAKPALTPVVAIPNRAPAMAFTRTHEQVVAKSAVGHLHNRMCEMERAIALIAQAQIQQTELLGKLLSK